MLTLNTIFEATPGKGIIKVELDAGGKVSIPRFGTFKTTRRKARTDINPRTKQNISIPAKNHPVFKAGKILKERVAK